MLTERQELILRLVVDAHLESGRPVGSKIISEQSGVEWGPSTVRAELAALEEGGYLTHPHTSAGRVPTDAGYRSYVDFLLESGSLPAKGPGSSWSSPSCGARLTRRCGRRPRRWPRSPT